MSDTIDPEWELRQLCPDDSCIGVLGSDGRCKVCGRSAGGDPFRPSIAPPRDDGEERADAEADFDEDRRLCPDDSCIGVLGADGRCKVCGRTSAATA